MVGLANLTLKNKKQKMFLGHTLTLALPLGPPTPLDFFCKANDGHNRRFLRLSTAISRTYPQKPCKTLKAAWFCLVTCGQLLENLT